MDKKKGLFARFTSRLRKAFSHNSKSNRENLTKSTGDLLNPNENIGDNRQDISSSVGDLLSIRQNAATPNFKKELASKLRARNPEAPVSHRGFVRGSSGVSMGSSDSVLSQTTPGDPSSSQLGLPSLMMAASMHSDLRPTSTSPKSHSVSPTSAAKLKLELGKQRARRPPTRLGATMNGSEQVRLSPAKLDITRPKVDVSSCSDAFFFGDSGISLARINEEKHGSDALRKGLETPGGVVNGRIRSKSSCSSESTKSNNFKENKNNVPAIEKSVTTTSSKCATSELSSKFQPDHQCPNSELSTSLGAVPTKPKRSNVQVESEKSKSCRDRKEESIVETTNESLNFTLPSYVTDSSIDTVCRANLISDFSGLSNENLEKGFSQKKRRSISPKKSEKKPIVESNLVNFDAPQVASTSPTLNKSRQHIVASTPYPNGATGKKVAVFRTNGSSGGKSAGFIDRPTSMYVQRNPDLETTNNGDATQYHSVLSPARTKEKSSNSESANDHEDNSTVSEYEDALPSAISVSTRASIFGEVVAKSNGSLSSISPNETKLGSKSSINSVVKKPLLTERQDNSQHKIVDQKINVIKRNHYNEHGEIMPKPVVDPALRQSRVLDLVRNFQNMQ